MTHEFLELLLLSYVGIIGHYIRRAYKAVDNDTIKDWFRPGKTRVKELLMLGLSVLSATVTVYLRNKITDIFVVNELGAVVVGFFSKDILTNVLLKAAKGKVPIPTDEE